MRSVYLQLHLYYWQADITLLSSPNTTSLAVHCCLNKAIDMCRQVAAPPSPTTGRPTMLATSGRTPHRTIPSAWTGTAAPPPGAWPAPCPRLWPADQPPPGTSRAGRSAAPNWAGSWWMQPWCAPPSPEGVCKCACVGTACLCLCWRWGRRGRGELQRVPAPWHRRLARQHCLIAQRHACRGMQCILLCWCLLWCLACTWHNIHIEDGQWFISQLHDPLGLARGASQSSPSWRVSRPSLSHPPSRRTSHPGPPSMQPPRPPPCMTLPLPSPATSAPPRPAPSQLPRPGPQAFPVPSSPRRDRRLSRWMPAPSTLHHTAPSPGRCTCTMRKRRLLLLKRPQHSSQKQLPCP